MKKRSLAFLCTLFFLLSSCGETIPETGYPASGEEERLVVYTSHKEEVYWPIVQEFERRTGIWVDVVAGGTNELLERIREESDSPGADSALTELGYVSYHGSLTLEELMMDDPAEQHQRDQAMGGI